MVVLYNCCPSPTTNFPNPKRVVSQYKVRLGFQQTSRTVQSPSNPSQQSVSAPFHPSGCPTASRHHAIHTTIVPPTTSIQAHLENSTRDWVLLFQACARTLAPIVLPLCIAHCPAASSLLKLTLSPWDLFALLSTSIFKPIWRPRVLNVSLSPCRDLICAKRSNSFLMCWHLGTERATASWTLERSFNSPFFKEVSSQLLPRKHPSHHIKSQMVHWDCRSEG